MKHRVFPKVLAVLFVFFSIISAGGVYATWGYSNLSPSDADKELTINMGIFKWEGAEELPSDIIGEDHILLIDKILNGKIENADGTTNHIGLNNPDSYISTEISDRSSGWITSETLGSMDFWERENIEDYFNLATDNLTFLLYFPDGVSDTYYLYTTSIVLGEQNAPNIPIGELIYPIYRTLIQKNAETGEFEAVETKTGYAESDYYSNPITGNWLIKYPSFDPTSWREGDLGGNKANAIYTYFGETLTAYPKDKSTAVYYEIPSVSTNNTPVNISSDNPNAQIWIYSSNGSLVSLTSGTQGSNNVTFSARRNTSYYYTVQGDLSITFTIKQN